MVSLSLFILEHLGICSASAAGAVGPYFNLFVRRQEKVVKVARVESSEVENQRRLHSPDLHVQDFR